MRRRISSAIIYSLIITLSSCSLFQSEIDSVTDLLPRDSDVPGWVKNASVHSYKAKDVKKYNRDYNGLGIEKLAATVYQSIDDKNVEIKLEVIRFNSVIDAYGFFSIKRGPGIFETADVNEFYSNSISIIQIGEYAVYSSTYKADLLLKTDLKTFVNIPLLYIGQNYIHDHLPDSLNVLKGVDGYGVLYSRKPYLKFPFLRNINFTQWLSNKDLIDVFFTEKDSFYDAYEIFKKSIDSNYIIISSDNTYTAFKKEQDNNYTFISVSDKWIFGCRSVSNINEGKKVLGEIRSRIEDYKKNIK